MPIEPSALIPRSFRAINGMRGPGAMAIAFGHLSVVMGLVAYKNLESIFMIVDMFFVFSGIVIAHVYADMLAQPSAIPPYIIRRFGRIWPVQVATLGVLVVYETAKLGLTIGFGVHFSVPPFSSNMLPQAIPTNLLLIQSLGLHDSETWNFPSWSLSVEFATYLLFALFCLLKPRLRYGLSLATILLSVAVLAFVAPYHTRSTFDYGIFRCIAGFLAGTILRDIVVRWKIPNYPMPTCAEFLAIGLFTLWMVMSINSPIAYAAPLVINLFLMAFISERGLVSRVLGSKPFQILAEASFSIYMVHAIMLIFLLAGLHEYAHLTHHQLFTSAANPLASRPGAAPTIQMFHIDHLASKWIIAAIYFVLVIAASAATHQWVEVPGRAAFGRLAARVEESALTSRPIATAHAKS